MTRDVTSQGTARHAERFIFILFLLRCHNNKHVIVCAPREPHACGGLRPHTVPFHTVSEVVTESWCE